MDNEQPYPHTKAPAQRPLIASVRCPKCSHIKVTTDATPRVEPCEKCGAGLKLDQDFFDRTREQAAKERAVREAQRAKQAKAARRQLLWVLAIPLGLIFGPPLISIIFGPGITHRGCSFSPDVVVLDHCWFSSFGLSIGATIAVSAVLLIPTLLWSAAKNKMRK